MEITDLTRRNIFDVLRLENMAWNGRLTEIDFLSRTFNLNNLATISQGLAELRNPFGTGHGKDAGSRGLNKRHARLAVGAATTLGVFLFETHQERPIS